jgi:hypothetical protein
MLNTLDFIPNLKAARYLASISKNCMQEKYSDKPHDHMDSAKSFVYHQLFMDPRARIPISQRSSLDF